MSLFLLHFLFCKKLFARGTLDSKCKLLCLVSSSLSYNRQYCYPEHDYEDLDRKYEELFSDYDWVERVLTDFFDRPLVQKEVPSISNVRAWLSSDRTDRVRYTAPDFACGDFAVMLAIHARAKYWDMGVIGIWGYETETYEEFNHAFNAIITKEGLIYVEPQTDEVWWYENHEEIRKGWIQSKWLSRWFPKYEEWLYNTKHRSLGELSIDEIKQTTEEYKKFLEERTKQANSWTIAKAETGKPEEKAEKMSDEEFKMIVIEKLDSLNKNIKRLADSLEKKKEE